jgi:hypothetical protein
LNLKTPDGRTIEPPTWAMPRDNEDETPAEVHITVVPAGLHVSDAGLIPFPPAPPAPVKAAEDNFVIKAHHPIPSNATGGQAAPDARRGDQQAEPSVFSWGNRRHANKQFGGPKPEYEVDAVTGRRRRVVHPPAPPPASPELIAWREDYVKRRAAELVQRGQVRTVEAADAALRAHVMAGGADAEFYRWRDGEPE